MSNLKMQRFFPKIDWRRWLETLRHIGEALDFNEIDLLERRIHDLEAQVSELRSKVGMA